MSQEPLPQQQTGVPAPWIADQTSQLLAQRGHAWLLHGPSGLGQYELALALVRAWLCEQPVAQPVASQDGQGAQTSVPQSACGQCGACHAISVHAHADLCVLMPETAMLALGWPLSEKAQSDIDDKKRKASKEIRIEAMRDALEFAQRTNARGRGKAVLVYPAERMNHVTANALLKTLEEPPGEVKFILASESAHQLLPTIRSRCLGHAMVWPESAAALSWLHAQGVAAADAPRLLRAAGGRPADALALAQAGQTPAAWAQLPRALARGDAAGLAALAQWPPAQVVDALQKVCHDLMAHHVGAAPRYFEVSDLPSPSGLPALARLSQWSEALAQTARSAEHPFNPGLMFEALASQARKALHSQSNL